MDIIVLVKFVPDLVEDLEIDAQSGLLDRSFLRLIPNELDEHALEEALLLKERHGGTVTVITVDTGDVDESLYTAAAKGVDRLIKITGEGFDQGVTNQALAVIFQSVMGDMAFDLILTGTQAVDDLDGFVGAMLAERMGLPYVGYVTRVEAENGTMVARKEYPGGLNADIEVRQPAVLGIQAAEKPPRYVVTSKVMEAMRSATIDEIEAPETPIGGSLPVSRMSVPETGAHAEMIEGTLEQIAEAVANRLREQGILA
ncbi:MAG TPA: electron transfer flavoprotein subunit beta/FixA family protein [Phycisphaerae bacterium]|nr:electron transfer flavoprotein subunit beta/FixA family protein [Phycisphaerae bacterium]